MPGPNQITPAQLARLIGTPDCPVLIDVRIAENVAEAPVLIPGSQLFAHTALPNLPAGTRAVVICKRGKKLSEGAAAMLRTSGVVAEVLEGGTLAWAEAGLPMVPLALMPQTALWVTRHRPKVDRIACPWLIRRFINREARFLFVVPADVPDVAENFAATPFDIEGVFWSHRGDTCTFDTLVSEFGLSTPALDRLATV
ncbi:MAG: chromate resistance protein ChrB domain-containing protein, partial [Paracoccaceae bacterium]